MDKGPQVSAANLATGLANPYGEARAAPIVIKLAFQAAAMINSALRAPEGGYAT
jgi:hypothetical protein